MAKLERIALRSENFPQWYTDVVKQSNLLEYGPVAGTMILKPGSYSIWETIQEALNNEFKKIGIQNVSFPLLMPLSFLEKEKDHIEGFAPEVAMVTRMGDRELEEPLVIRPTSEVLFCNQFAKQINSHNDLPIKYNQWCNVFRSEKTTRPFLRSSEFLWQEGHTVHAHSREASALSKKMIKVYAKFCRDYLAMPTIIGEKTVGERFAGAKSTYTIEALMQDGRALQSGTSHYFADKFSKTFGIKFQNADQKLEHAYQTSWGVSTRLIGALIMTHSDDRGLVLPPKMASHKVAIMSVMGKKNPHINDKAKEISKLLKKHNPLLDVSNKGPGFKASQLEISGYPIRIEVGPRDLENNQVVVVRRDTLEKELVNLDELKAKIDFELKQMQSDLLKKAQERLDGAIVKANTFEDMEKSIRSGKIVLMPWSGSKKDEDRLKEETEGDRKSVV